MNVYTSAWNSVLPYSINTLYNILYTIILIYYILSINAILSLPNSIHIEDMFEFKSLFFFQNFYVIYTCMYIILCLLSQKHKKSKNCINNKKEYEIQSYIKVLHGYLLLSKIYFFRWV